MPVNNTLTGQWAGTAKHAIGACSPHKPEAAVHATREATTGPTLAVGSTRLEDRQACSCEHKEHMQQL